MSGDDWDLVANEWVRHNPQRLWRSHSDAVNRALLDRWLPNDADAVLKTDLFDEAFGDGIVPVLAKRARRLYGIDVSAVVAQVARERYPSMTSLRADVRSLPFADGTFDVVVSISTLDHFRSHADIAASLGEIHRTMKRGGLLVVTLDNRANPVVAARSVLPYRVLHAVGLVPYFTGATYGPRGLERALERAAFGVLAKTAVLHCPRVAAVPLAALLQKRASERTREWFCRQLARFECLGNVSTRYLTGHYVAMRAVKR